LVSAKHTFEIAEKVERMHPQPGHIGIAPRAWSSQDGERPLVATSGGPELVTRDENPAELEAGMGHIRVRTPFALLERRERPTDGPFGRGETTGLSKLDRPLMMGDGLVKG
jgi:hypothetical protein